MPSGSKPGERRGGRQKGTPNKKTQAALKAQAEAAAAIAAALPAAFAGNAYALLCATYKDTRLPLDIRLDAAKTALPFEMPKLQAIEHTGQIDTELTISDEIRSQVIGELLDEIDGKARPGLVARIEANSAAEFIVSNGLDALGDAAEH